MSWLKVGISYKDDKSSINGGHMRWFFIIFVIFGILSDLCYIDDGKSPVAYAINIIIEILLIVYLFNH